MTSPSSKADAPPKSDPSKEMVEFKSNGKMVRMTRAEADGHASMAYAASEKFKEAKEIRATVDKLINTAKTNPIQALMDPALGLSKDQIRKAVEEWYHKEYIEPDTLSDDQKKIRDYEKELKTFREEQELNKKKAADEEMTRLTNHQKEYLSKQIIEALDASGLPKIPWFAQRMAFYMRQNMINGWEAPTAMIVDQVKKERAQMMSDVSQGSTAEQLIELFGPDVINKIRQHDLKQLRDKRGLANAPFTGKGEASETSKYLEGERLSYRDVNKRLNDMRTGKL